MYREFVVWKQVQEASHQRDVTIAWTTAALTRAKKLPALKTLLAKASDGRQNAKQLRTVLQVISATYRIPLKQRKKKARTN